MAAPSQCNIHRIAQILHLADFAGISRLFRIIKPVRTMRIHCQNRYIERLFPF